MDGSVALELNRKGVDEMGKKLTGNEGKTLVMGDEIVVKFERGSERASVARAAECASRIYGRGKRRKEGNREGGGKK